MSERDDWKAGRAPVFESDEVIEVQGKKMLQKHWAEANRITEMIFRACSRSLDGAVMQDEALQLVVRRGQIIS